MQRNVSGQKWRVFAFDRTTSAPKTGDAANITATLSKDGAAGTATGTTNPTELSGGYYEFPLTQAETNANDLLLVAASVTANIVVLGCPASVTTTPVDWATDIVQTGDAFARLGTNGAALTALGDTRLANLDAAISTRLASANYTAPLDADGVRSAVGLASANLDTQIDAIPTAAENATAVAAQVTTDHGAGSYIRNTEPLDAAGVRTAVGLATANLDTQLGDLPTNSELTTALAGADDAVLAAIAALNNLSSAGAQAAAAAALSAYGAATGAQVGAVLTTQMTESYSVDGSAPTAAQALFAVLQRLTEFSIADTTITVKKLDGSTTAFELTLDDASAPTSSTRSA